MSPVHSSAATSDPPAEPNPQQLDAVRHGIGDEAHDTRALLVIAGAAPRGAERCRPTDQRKLRLHRPRGRALD